MSKARDIANILSASTSIATDAEVTAAVSTHATAANGHIGRGTTDNRPASPSVGDLYFDTTLASLIAYKTSGWEKVSQDPAPLISSISPTTSASTGNSITITGSDFRVGALVQFIGTNASVYNAVTTTFNSANSLSATRPALPTDYEPYDIKVVNADNQFSVLDNALDVGGNPTWSTSSGSLGSFLEQSAVSLSLSASDPDGTSIAYSSSNLPSWLTLNSSTGSLTGTSPDVSSSTTYTFNVAASDGTNSTSREFSILVRPYAVITGGQTTSDSTYIYRRITSNAEVVVSNSPLVADVLVVGAGGGGGANNAGGGGGGGVVYYEGYTFTPGSYQANIGTGGLGFVGANTNNWGARGQNSTFIGITALGGGGGEGGNPVSPASSPNKNGGSGGGGCRGISPGSATQTNSGGGLGFGNNGSINPINSLGGGGGGAGSGGGTGANGGAGKTYWGFTVGAGGGGGAEGSGQTAGQGGSSVGGAGGAGNGATAASGWSSGSGQDAVANTGSGGGGESAGFQDPSRGGNGSDGVVIIRYTKTQVGA